MNKIVKQSVGIDVDQKELVVTLGRMYDYFSIKLFAYKVLSKIRILFGRKRRKYKYYPSQ